jgi:alginate O-acetyltransferase complex protein AlgI
MLFNSLPFLFVFLPIVYLNFLRLRKSKQLRYVWLTVTGYVFYSYWNPYFCALMALSTMVSFGAGLGMLRWNDSRTRGLLVAAAVMFDLLLLGFFKYANFGAATFNDIAAMAGAATRLPTLAIILPVGISFYTFHTITYIVDCYRGTIVPTRNFFEFASYVSLFSQLVAGPIVRFREVEEDLEHIDKPSSRADTNRGWSFFVLGMIKKVLIADSIALVINPAFEHWETLSTAGAWLCALGYTYELYFDFSGYSDMAVGLGCLFGIHLPQNFNSPYKAVDIADFWRRWHISLSRVLRDYLYIPLGGSRGSSFLIFRNLMITMLLGGLWHGASWTFVFWGGYHGVLLVVNRLAAKHLNRVPVFVRQAVTFLLVIIGWVFFRSTTFSQAWGLLRAMFSYKPGMVMTGWAPLTIVLIVAAIAAHVGPNTFEVKDEWTPMQTAMLGALFLACILAIAGARSSPFLYFQF